MERKALIDSLENGNYKNLYLIYGKDFYLIEEIENIIKGIVDENLADFNLSIIDGKEFDIESIVTSIETLPFMSEYRVIIVRDAEIFKSKKAISKDDENILTKVLSNMPNTTILLFTVYGDIDKRKSISKVFEKNGVVCDVKKLDDVSLLSWCKDEFSKRSVEITNSDLAYFIEISGYRDKNSENTLSDLKNEIDKLTSYALDTKKIDKASINLLINDKVENDIFLLIDMISSKNSKRAMSVLDDMIDSGESMLSILAMLSRQFNQILQIKSLVEKKMPVTVISENLKINKYVLNKLVRYASNFDNETIFNILNYLSESDYKIKTGLMDDKLVSEIFILKYCSSAS
ncbi:MAG: DNA polymerase III subunit delta [Peptostreptococcus porci]|nr:DNA polymerase III subunit delta [Peptostreptococcus porci]